MIILGAQADFQNGRWTGDGSCSHRIHSRSVLRRAVRKYAVHRKGKRNGVIKTVNPEGEIEDRQNHLIASSTEKPERTYQ